jgi:hypothetical protein
VYLTQAQLSTCLRMRHDGFIPVTQINTITLASMLRKGAFKVSRKKVQMTSLGESIFKWNLGKEFQSWKEDLSQARKLKR